MADFMLIKYENPKLEQSELANRIGYSSATLQRNRNDVNMVSPYRINPNNTNKRMKKTSNNNSDNNLPCEPEVKRPQITSNGLKTTRTNNKNINFLKTVSMLENIEINDQYSDEILDKHDI